MQYQRHTVTYGSCLIALFSKVNKASNHPISFVSPHLDSPTPAGKTAAPRPSMFDRCRVHGIWGDGASTCKDVRISLVHLIIVGWIIPKSNAIEMGGRAGKAGVWSVETTIVNGITLLHHIGIRLFWHIDAMVIHSIHGRHRGYVSPQPR